MIAIGSSNCRTTGERAQLELLQAALDAPEQLLGGGDLVVELGPLEAQHAVELVERHAFLKQCADLRQRQPQVLMIIQN